MSRNPFTGILILAAIIASLVYLWRPWSEDPALKLGLDLQGGLRVMLQARPEEGRSLTQEDLVAARGVVENRINEFGVAEPVVQTSGTDRIIVELPGLSSEDQDRALDLIGQQALLEFRLVRTGAVAVPEEIVQESWFETIAQWDGPVGYNGDPEAGGRPVAFRGDILSNATTGFDRLGLPVVMFTIQGKYGNLFGQFSGSNLGREMAIILDDVVMSTPYFQGAITTEGQINGQFTMDEANDLALVLRSGSLPVALSVEESRSVGPTLGVDSIQAGQRAALIGGAAVVVAVLLYYGPLFGGALALGLVLAMLFIFGVLAGLGAVLTLPGLAGLVLTIGAAVDGNVISFERIKEELRKGKGLRLSMKNGFQQSLPAIIDANVTTLLAAMSLYQYTSGPVRGFAITLAIGIVASVFVNTVVVPFMLDVVTTNMHRPLMSKASFNPNWQFVKNAPLVMSFSLLLIIGAIFLINTRGLNFSTDFTGGSSILYDVPDGLTSENIRGAIDELAFGDLSGDSATIQEVVDNTISGNLMSVRVPLVPSAEGSAQFPSALAAAINAELLQADFVGPSVGEELRQSALMALLVALGCILLWVSVRFWPNWIIAIGAILAVIHDVTVVLGINVVMGSEFSIPVLAAILFVVGYSLNDSIIISDRIRENFKKTKGRDYGDIVDMSVNQTLSRTLVTSVTTLLPVLALFLFGGSVLRDFSLTLLIGIGVGTYSSIFILAPLVVWFKNRQRQRARVKNTQTAKA